MQPAFYSFGNLAFLPMPLSGIATPERKTLTEKADDTDRKKGKNSHGP
jgi:hypothetical protein